MVRAPHRPFSAGAALFLLACLLSSSLLPRGAAEAQMVEGPLVPGGQLRVEVNSLFETWDTRFGTRTEDGRTVTRVEPLGLDVTAEEAGTRLIPGLRGAEEALREALDEANFRIRMGRSRAHLEVARIRIPLRMDVGITDWLTLGGTLALVKRRTEVGFSLRSDSLITNVGLGPGVDDPFRVEGFLGELAEALSSMEARVVDVCDQEGEGSPECQDAQSVLSGARTFDDALRTAFRSGSLFPFEGSGAGIALQARLQGFQEAFQEHGVEGVPSRLPLASEPLSEEEFHEMLTDPAFGISASPLEGWESRWSLGDAEIHAAARIVEGTVGEAEDPTLRYLVGGGALLRLPTGELGRPDHFLDPGSGDGQTDLELRLFGHLILLQRTGAWVDLRYGAQFEGEAVRRISAPDEVFPPLSARARLRWDPGDYREARITPRFHLTPELAVAAPYRYFHKATDRYALVPGSEGEAERELPDPSLLERESRETLHEIGLGVVYSTRAVQDRALAPFPFELRALYRAAVAGSGGQTPRTRSFQVGLRLYGTLWGGRERGPGPDPG